MPAVASFARSSKRRVADESPGAGVLQDVAHLRRRQPPVDRHGDGAERSWRRRSSRGTPGSCRRGGRRRHPRPRPARAARRPEPSHGPPSRVRRRPALEHRDRPLGRALAWWASTENQLTSALIPIPVLLTRILPDPLASPACACRRTPTPAAAPLGIAARGHHRHLGTRVRAARLPRHRDHGALRGQRSRQGRALPLHRVQGGAAGRDPRPCHGRGHARCRAGGRSRRDALRAAGHARRGAARRDPPLPRSRLGLPARVPRPHRDQGRAVPGQAPGIRAACRGRAARRRRVRGVPRHRPLADARGRGSACTTTPICG